jgi:ATP/maltotriose-dependent transcriptional regulator MalT
VQSLFELTQGWPAALGFAVMNVARGLPLSAALAATRDIAYRFLAEQVFESLHEPQRRFLLDTCVLDTLEPEVLRYAGFTDATATLEQLRTQVSFVHRDDGEYRYHDLFRAFLRNELARSDAQWSKAWLVAGGAYEKVAAVDSALHAYMQVPDHHDEAVRLLETHGLLIIERGRRDIVDAALEKLPYDEHPVLIALRANAAINAGQMGRGDALYKRAIEVARDDTERVQLASQYADDLTRRGSRAEVIEVLEPLLGASAPPELKAGIFGTLAVALCRSERGDEAKLLIENALEVAERLDSSVLRATIYHQAGFIAFHEGKREVASSYATAALGIARSNDLYGLSARAQSVLMNIAFDSDDTGQVLWSCRQMEKVAREAGDMISLFTALIGTYDAEVERAGVEAMARLDEELKIFDSSIFPRASEALAPAFALRATWAGAYDEAVRFLAGTEKQPGSWRSALRAAEIALYSAAAGLREDAETLFAFAQRELREPNTVEPYSAKRHARTLLFLALAALLLGRAATANNLIAEAERLGPLVSKRYRELTHVTRSLYVHVETGVTTEDFEEALEGLQHSGLGGLVRMIAMLPLPQQSASSISTLTKAEIRVLRNMTSIASTRVLAEVLGIARSTVESHIKSIRRKLNCTTRHQAIQIARERGII